MNAILGTAKASVDGAIWSAALLNQALARKRDENGEGPRSLPGSVNGGAKWLYLASRGCLEPNKLINSGGQSNVI